MKAGPFSVEENAESVLPKSSLEPPKSEKDKVDVEIELDK
jgi:hypothetical protein